MRFDICILLGYFDGKTFLPFVVEGFSLVVAEGELQHSFVDQTLSTELAILGKIADAIRSFIETFKDDN